MIELKFTVVSEKEARSILNHAEYHSTIKDIDEYLEQELTKDLSVDELDTYSRVQDKLHDIMVKRLYIEEE
jgi:uncharacterized membrane protein YebE (DUF533 family)